MIKPFLDTLPVKVVPKSIPTIILWVEGKAGGRAGLDKADRRVDRRLGDLTEPGESAGGLLALVALLSLGVLEGILWLF